MRLRNILAAAALALAAMQVMPVAYAQSTTDETAFWEMVRDSGDAVVLERFLQRFPNGQHAADARVKLDALNDGGEIVPPEPAGTAPAASAATPAPAGTGDTIRMVQIELQRAGCAPGTPDGDWGGRSRAALGRFASATGLGVGNANPDGALLATLRAYPGTICVAAAPAPAPVPAPVAAASESKVAPDASCVMVKVTANRYKSGGKDWDIWAINGEPEPDIILEEKNLGLKARCDNSFTCQLQVRNPPATLSIHAYDLDTTLDERIAKGSCTPGSSCQFEHGTVTFGKC